MTESSVSVGITGIGAAYCGLAGVGVVRGLVAEYSGLSSGSGFGRYPGLVGWYGGLLVVYCGLAGAYDGDIFFRYLKHSFSNAVNTIDI
jgi:hypothetical protein